MYNSYEEYMQNVLGLNVPNTYGQGNMGYYGDMQMQTQVQMQNLDTNFTEVNKYYPEIYRILYPMIQKACSKGNRGLLNEAQINEMVEEVYSAIEPGDDILQGVDNGSTPRNGDVKNPRVKETRRPNKNYLLRDLIRILIIRELLQGGGNMPPRPPMGGMPGGPGGPGGRPPMMGPRFMGMY